MTDQPLRAVFIAFAAMILLSTAGTARSQPQDFDFYVLSLSWSPTYCSTRQGERSSLQCGSEHAYGFIVHGLWPQFETGYPEFCRSREPGRVPRAVGETVLDIMPSMGLIGHQWRKHGSCTGLSQRDYFSQTRKALERIRLPADLATTGRRLNLSADEIERKFLDANPGMSRRGIAAGCEGRQLEEVRICFTKTFEFRECAEVDRRGCRLDRIDVPPTE